MPKHEYGRFKWRPDNRHPSATGWMVIGPDGTMVAWTAKLSDASKYAVWAEALLQHYLDRKPGVYDNEHEEDR